MVPPRFYLPPDGQSASLVSLPEREAHHAQHVLRMRTGQPLILLNGQGDRLHCRVERLGRHTLEALVLRKEAVPPIPWKLHLLQAVTKTKSIETIIQKATELGAARVVPLWTDRVITKLEPGRSKTDKWRWIAIDAMKQCDNAWLPAVEDPISLADYLARGETFDLELLGSLESTRHPATCFNAFQTANGRAPETLAIWIGPEGDFTPTELERIQAAGAQPISLGPRILRADTAATYCLAIANYELQARWGVIQSG